VDIALGEIAEMKYTTIINKKQFEIEVLGEGRLLVNGVLHEVDFLELRNSLFSIIKDNRSLEIVIDETNPDQYEIMLGGRLYDGQVLDERAMLMINRKGGIKLNSGEVNSPMPGLIVEVRTTVGATVQEGQTVVILESMKMQNELKAPRSGTVLQIAVSKGQTVEKGALLVEIGD
jgi:biotin carboxyl carrier protein